MNEIVRVHNNDVIAVEWKGERVVTTAQLADVYGSSEAQIKQNFNNNENRFEEDKHFYLLKGTDLKAFKSLVENFDLVDKHAPQLYLWTKRGASRHSKMLGTDKAWEQFDYLEESYFNKMNILEGISPELQAAIVVDKRVTKVENRIEKLENNMTITHEQIRILTTRINLIIVKLLGGEEANAYKDKSLRGKAYSRINRDFCDYFRINARANTLAAKFDEALRYLDVWQPETNLRIRIEDSNAQINMEVA